MSNKLYSSEDDKIEEEVFFELEKLVYHIAHLHENPNNPMMGFDEIVGELFLEIAKGLKYYQGKPKKELIPIIKKMISNRISELKYKFYLSYRQSEKSMISIDIVINVSSEELSPEECLNGRLFIESVRGKLSEDAVKVFDCIVYGNPRLTELLRVSGIRSGFAYKGGGMIKIRSYHLADALFLDECVVRDCMKEIEEKYSEELEIGTDG